MLPLLATGTHTGWSMAWKANVWARVNDGDRAAVAEMLIQSHDGIVTLLPAIPAAWKDGQVSGLRARGHFTVDMKWKDGKVTGYRISSPQAAEVKVKANGEVKTVKSNAQ